MGAFKLLKGVITSNRKDINIHTITLHKDMKRLGLRFNQTNTPAKS